MSTGNHELTATYSGHDTFAASTGHLSQVVTLDQAVDAGSFGVSYGTFYPVKDTYRDTVAIRGTLREPATVTIHIYSVATGKRVRFVQLGTKSGAYNWSWDGRSSTGTLLAATKYRVVQELVDTGQNHLLSTSFVASSHKKLQWYTGTKTVYGNQFILKGDPGDGYVSTAKPKYARGARISSGHSWAAVAYNFPIPKAAAYGNVTFKVLGRSPIGRRAVIAIWNANLGGSAYIESYDAAKVIGPGYAWYSTSAPLSNHQGSGRARGMVYVQYTGGVQTFDISKVSATYRYALLK